VRSLLGCSALALLFVHTAAFAALSHPNTYYPKDFYSKVDGGLNGAPLKKSLYAVLSSFHRPHAGDHDDIAATCASGCYKHISLGYTAARKALFGEMHLEKHGTGYAVRDVYCQHLSTASDYKNNPPGPGQIPDPSVINVEHTWPQSRFSGRFDKNMQKSDLHILYPALANANTSRSNNEFSEVVSVISAPCPKSRRGYSSDGTRTVYFEPPEAHKGNVARAIFYFSARYQLAVSAEEEASLKAWHQADPPDRFERERNEIIFTKQKVRNPFIDHPELVELVGDF